MSPDYTLSIASTRESIRAVEPFLKAIVHAEPRFQCRFHDLLIAITEAVNNAIIHGNCDDASKNVVVSISMGTHHLVARVSDAGQGFQPAVLPDPSDPANVHQEGGRGVFLIRHLADDVSVETTSHGTTVIIKFCS